MSAEPQTDVIKERYSWAVAAIQLSALLAGVAVFVVSTDSASWHLGQLFAISVLAVASDLTSVPANFGKMRVSRPALGVMLAAVLLGGGPAAIVGMLAILIGWFRWRESPPMLATNFVVYLWFPLLSGLFFHAAIRLWGVSSGASGYYLLILPTFVVGLVINFVGVTAHDCYRSGANVFEKVREGIMAILAAELFSAVLIVAAV